MLINDFIDFDYQFCSENEVKYRQDVNDVHVFESTDNSKYNAINDRIIDPKKAIKKYYRSGTENLSIISNPRSFYQLVRTIDYLCYNIWNIDITNGLSTDINIRYAFVMDRLAAIKQELTIYYDNYSVQINGLYHILHILMYILRFYSFIYLTIKKYKTNLLPNEVDISTWFDMSLHSNAITSCLTQAINISNEYIYSNRQITNSFINLYNELIINYLLLTITNILLNKLTNIFQDHSNINSITNNIRTAIITKIENCLSVHDFFDFQKFNFSIINNDVIFIIWKIISSFKTSNLCKVIRLFTVLINSELSLNVKLCISNYYSQLLPLLRIWRLVLADRTANKNEVISMVDLNRRVWWNDSINSNVLYAYIGMSISSNDSNSYVLNNSHSLNDSDVTKSLKYCQDYILYDSLKRINEITYNDKIVNSANILDNILISNKAKWIEDCELFDITI